MKSKELQRRWPNLFLIGAPKCGTTAMSHYLAGHPQIFMSEEAGVKEPWFFNDDLDGPWRVCRNADDYLALYDEAPDNALYWGDATPTYLYSDVAIERVLRASPDARFIAMVRNPIDLVQALFNQLTKGHYETAVDFGEAWALQERRLADRGLLPAGIANPKLFQYGEYSKIGNQLQRALRQMDRDHIHIIVYDDFAENPEREYRRVLGFLGVKDDNRADFPVLNQRNIYRYPSLHVLLGRIAQIRRRLNIPGGWGINALIDRFNVIHGSTKNTLSHEMRRELATYFREDVKQLSDILRRDLSFWLCDD